MKNGKVWKLLLVCLCLVLLTPGVGVQGAGRDLTELSMEELSELTVFSVDVLGTHTHQKGEWMLSYSFMYMEMSGYRSGTSSVLLADVLSTYRFASQKMTRKTHMFGVMYAPTERITLKLMIPVHRITMDHHVASTGDIFDVEANGIGDLEFKALFTVYETMQGRWILTTGLGAPTGSITTAFPEIEGVDHDHTLGYPMRLGSGSWSFSPAISYLGENDMWGWGSELGATFYLDDSSADYRLGDRVWLSGWFSRKLTDRTALTGRLNALSWDNISGEDHELHPAWMPAGDPNFRGGDRVDLLVGINFLLPGKNIQGTRFALEIGFPLYQDLDGIQLENKWSLRGGVQWVF